MIDARGYACPMPVILVQKEINSLHPDTLEVLVDESCARENVTRLAESCGYQVAVTIQGTDYRLVLKK
jgi:tRNA 2-thiouridine synthesizing protein A